MLTLERAVGILLYGGQKPSDVSPQRWRAIVAHIMREHAYLFQPKGN